MTVLSCFPRYYLTPFPPYFRDRLTTPVNVWASCVACAVVEHLSRDELERIDDVYETSEACSDVTAETNSVAIDIVEEEEGNMEKKVTADTNIVAIDIVEEEEGNMEKKEETQNIA